MITTNLSKSNSIANVYLAELRDKFVQKDRLKFRINLKRLGQIMGYEISKEMTYTQEIIETPLGNSSENLLANQPIIIAIMRAALPFYEGVLSVFDKADSGFVGAYRTTDFRTSKSIRTEYIATGNLQDKTVILVDPMLATGKSMLDAINNLEASYGKPKRWIILSVIATPEGISYLENNLKGKQVTLWYGAIDKELNSQFYIIPGLGDAGDLAFGEKLKFMLQSVGLLVLGLFVLIIGGDFLVKGASNIALKTHISPLVIGLTIVAFGTSVPELLISINAAMSGSPDLAMGNIIGSNICNLALVLGIMLLINPVKVNANSIKIDWPVVMISTILLFVWAQDRNLGSTEGVFFVFFILSYTIYIIRKSRMEGKESESKKNAEEVSKTHTSGWLKNILFIVMGGLCLYFGSNWFVNEAKLLALFLGVSQRIIGITVLALGTSLPELVTAIVASFKNETDLALGNLIGSNIFNILSILGITCLIHPITINKTLLAVDMLWMLGVTLIIFPLMLINRKLGKLEGGILLCIYIYYTYTVIS